MEAKKKRAKNANLDGSKRKIKMKKKRNKWQKGASLKEVVEEMMGRIVRGRERGRGIECEREERERKRERRER